MAKALLLLLMTLAFPLLFTRVLRADENPPPAFYYVDPVAGDDNHDGLSPKTAWKTWTPFHGKASPGSSLLLKRGQVFALPLPLVGGSFAAPVVYGAYGDGPKPIFEGHVVNLSRPEAWTEDSTGIWRTTANMPDTANLIFEDSLCGNKRDHKQDLRNPGEWFQQANGKGPLFVYSPVNPAGNWQKVEVVATGDGIDLMGPALSHIRFENLCLRKIGTHGINIGGGIADVTIRGCDLSLIGGAVYRFDAFSLHYGRQFVERRVRFGNAIQTWANVSDLTVEGCRIGDIFDGGFDIQGFHGSVAQNVTVRNNVIWNCGYDSLDIAHGVWTCNVVFEHNTCANAGEGWALQGEPWPRYSVNFPDNVGFHFNLESSYGWDSRCEVIVRNNIFYNAPKSRCFTCGANVPTPLIVVDNNGYDQSNPADALAQVGTNSFTAATFDAYRKLTGWDQHSILADPLFVDPAAGDFRQKPGSPCAGLGSESALQPE
jgi:hypothetical protein